MSENFENSKDEYILYPASHKCYLNHFQDLTKSQNTVPTAYQNPREPDKGVLGPIPDRYFNQV